MRAFTLALLLSALPSVAAAQSFAAPAVLLVGGTYGSPIGPAVQVHKLLMEYMEFSPSLGGAIGPGGLQVNVGAFGWMMPEGRPREGSGILLSLLAARTFSDSWMNNGTPNSTYVGGEVGFHYNLFYGSAGYVRRLGGSEPTGRHRFQGSAGFLIPIVGKRR